MKQRLPIIAFMFPRVAIALLIGIFAALALGWAGNEVHKKSKADPDSLTLKLSTVKLDERINWIRKQRDEAQKRLSSTDEFQNLQRWQNYLDAFTTVGQDSTLRAK